MTTKSQLDYDLTYLATEAYIAGVDNGEILYFTPGSKTQGNSPVISTIDGRVPRYIPQFKVGESNGSVQAKITAVIGVFHAFREARDAGKKPLV
jgi:hypothetical protein